MKVLVLNPGSSTLRAALVTHGRRDGAQATVDWPPGDHDAESAADALSRVLTDVSGGPEAVGYRVVHGGAGYRRASRVDEALIRTVGELDVLAPLHNRRAAAMMRAGASSLPDVPHVASFDTAFHADLPEEAWRYPLPRAWVERWSIRRYGFHGLSVQWACRRAAEILGRPVADLGLVIAHLGSGCSVTAVDGGRSADTSMGFTPYEGLMMATRSGSVDPGILLHLSAAGVSTSVLSAGLARESGLRAVGASADVRKLVARGEAGDTSAQLALAMFARRAAGGIAAAATALPRLDAIVFTGGIGEHASTVRSDVCRRLRPIGVPSELRPADGDTLVADGPPAVLVVEAREDLVVAAEVMALLGPGTGPAPTLAHRT